MPTPLRLSYRGMKDDDARPARLLLADDDRTLLTLLEMRLKALGYVVDCVTNGDEAWDYLQEAGCDLDAVVLDRIMPGPDGIELLRRMKGLPQLRQVPVVMQTAADRPEQIQEGIDAGVFYYLTKPCPENVLANVVAAAVRESRHRRALRRDIGRQTAAFELVQKAQAEFKTLVEAENMAVWSAHFFSDPVRVVGGLAALMINAVEHGNLGIGYALKGELLAAGTWWEEVERRLQLQENRKKCAKVEIVRGEGGIKVSIRDSGPGFDWRRYMTIDAGRAQSSHGRGIAQARVICFDGLEYNQAGNTVTVWMNSKKAV